eukprot:scaffold2611_cov214-Pinguiococcus_pyrenoidosus.AAC.1
MNGSGEGGSLKRAYRAISCLLLFYGPLCCKMRSGTANMNSILRKWRKQALLELSEHICDGHRVVWPERHGYTKGMIDIEGSGWPQGPTVL